MGLTTKMKSFRNDIKLFIKYLGVYAFILIIVIILMVPIYSTIYSTTKGMILNETYNQLKYSSVDLDNRILKLKAVAEIMRENENLQTLANVRGFPDTKDYYSLERASSVCSTNLNIWREPNNAYTVLFKSNNILISPKNGIDDFTLRNFSGVVFANQTLHSVKEQIFEDDRMMMVLPQQPISINNITQESIAVVFKPVGAYPYGYDSAFLFYVGIDELLSLMKIDADTVVDFMYMTTSNDEMIMSENYSKEPLKVNDGIHNIKLENTKYTVLSSSSSSTGFKIVLGIDNKIFESKISGIIGILQLYALIAFIILVLLCCFFALSRAKVMHQLVSLFNGQDHWGDNEYQFLSASIKSVQSHNKLYKTQLAELSEELQKSMLEKITLRGVYESDVDFQWDFEFFCVLCVRCKYVISKEQCAGTFLELSNCLSNGFDFISVNNGISEMVYIINLTNQSQRDIKAIYTNISVIAEDIPNISIGISAIGYEIKNLNTCYYQANIALRQMNNHQQVNIYETHVQTVDAIFNVNISQQLYEVIAAGKMDEIILIFSKILRHVSICKPTTESEILQLFFNIRFPLTRITNEILKIDSQDRIPEYTNQFTIEELIDGLKQASLSLCDLVNQRKKSNNSSLRDGIITYLENNYVNKELCVTYVAEKFSITEKYLSSFIKEQTGFGFSTYLENIRLSKAKQLLLETDYNANKISAMVGYSTVDAFYKSFKKKFGLPPGQWKSSIKTKGDIHQVN